MASFTVNYYLDDRLFNYFNCPISDTIQDFLVKIMKIYHYYEEDEEIDFSVYLKGKIVPKEDKIEKYLNDLHYYAFFITKYQSEELQINPNPTNINDYEIQDPLKVLYQCKAINKKTNKNVTIHFFESSRNPFNNYITNIYDNNLFNSPEIPKINHYYFSIDNETKKKFKRFDPHYNYNFFVIEENLFDYSQEDFFKYLRSKGSDHSKMNPTKRSKLIFGVASIIKKIHKKKIVFLQLDHKTVKLNENYEPKIFDFSMSKFSTDRIYDLSDPEDYHWPNLLFWAPERITDDFIDHPFTSADVYSFAIFLFEMFNSGNYTLDDKKGRIKTPKQFLMKISKGARFIRPKYVPDHYWELIQRCWQEDPKKRPTFDEIVEILKDDKYALTEFGVETNLIELHDYQDRVENLDNRNNRIESLQNEVNELKKQIEDIQKKQQKSSSNSNLNILDSEMIHSLRIIREISSGGSGKVLEVGKEEKFALKVMHTGDNSIDDFRAFIEEYEKLKMLKHPNIIEAYGIFMSDATTPPSILLELCPYDLRYSIKNKIYKTNGEIVIWIYQIVEGMKFVHKHKFVHRDLKPSNILIGKDGKIRISDFGIAKLMTSEEQSTSRGAGTQKFLAPEILREEKYNEKADVYSFGVLLYYILSGGEMPKINIIQIGTGVKAPIPESFTPFAKDMINECWNFDAKDRPNFDQILSLLESHNYKLIELTDSEVQEVFQFVKEHKKSIPN